VSFIAPAPGLLSPAPSPAIDAHLAEVRGCTICPRMQRPAVAGRPVASRILLVGQAPGVKEPVLGRPFAWTAGKTLFKWIESALGWDEDETRDRIYFAAVCRCFPGKNPKGGDRVPDPDEITACSRWLRREFEILQPSLVIAVGKLAISQFHPFALLSDVVGGIQPIRYAGHACDLLPLPHPSGASTWHRMEPGKSLLAAALQQLAAHPAVRNQGIQNTAAMPAI
jgi:uracil-DNA glycosylase